MLKKETNDEGGVVNNWARPCDTCQSAACTVYCRADSAYLCSGCDARVHAANRLASRHERVWVCEACERAPAAFLCKADAASLCSSCDADIHSANPLARRHQRVPIPPISGYAQGPPTCEQRRRGVASAAETEDDFIAPEADEDEAASWLLLNPGKDGTYQNTGLLFGEEEDEYLDLEEYTSSAETQFTDQYNQSHQSCSTQQKNNGIDCAVPIQNGGTKYQLQQQQQNLQFSTEYESSKTTYSYNGSISNRVRFLPLQEFKNLI